MVDSTTDPADFAILHQTPSLTPGEPGNDKPVEIELLDHDCTYATDRGDITLHRLQPDNAPMLADIPHGTGRIVTIGQASPTSRQLNALDLVVSELMDSGVVELDGDPQVVTRMGIERLELGGMVFEERGEGLAKC